MSVIFGFICLYQAVMIVSVFTPPKEVRIGGLFPMFHFRAPFQQSMAGFLMAIKEINKDPTILPNSTIKISVRDSKLDVGTTFIESLYLAKDAFGGLGVDGIIGPATSAESSAAATVLAPSQMVQISYAATSPDLSTKVNYPYFARSCVSDAFQGAALADLVKSYGW
jgi:ABC-type branched-subunit amino acid transport system substrate-binding protein